MRWANVSNRKNGLLNAELKVRVNRLRQRQHVNADQQQVFLRTALGHLHPDDWLPRKEALTGRRFLDAPLHRDGVLVDGLARVVEDVQFPIGPGEAAAEEEAKPLSSLDAASMRHLHRRSSHNHAFACPPSLHLPLLPGPTLLPRVSGGQSDRGWWI